MRCNYPKGTAMITRCLSYICQLTVILLIP